LLLKAANPLPIHDFSLDKFVGPTGALTQIKMSFGLVIFIGFEHHILGVGENSPKSTFP